MLIIMTKKTRSIIMTITVNSTSITSTRNMFCETEK